MNFLHFIFGRAWGVSPPQDLKSPDGAAAKNLHNLPTELIISIAESISINSASCLALCNRHLSQILGPKIWTSLQHQDHSSRMEFLTLLAAGLPQYFACHSCVRLHRSSAVRWPRSVFSYQQDLFCFENVRGHHYQWPPSLYLIKFPHIQSAMKRHRYGPEHGFPLEVFSYSEVEDEGAHLTTLFTYEARIVNDELLMRSQQWLLVPSDRRESLYTQRLLHHLCEHISWAHPSRRNNNLSLPGLVKSTLDLLQARQPCSTGTQQCSQCYMDYVIDAVDFDEKGVALLVTRWINLGAGFTPEDPKWRNHMKWPRDRGAVYQPQLTGSIRLSFEDQEGQSLRDVTQENISKLFSKRKTQPLTRGYDGFVWEWNSWTPSYWYLR